MSTQRLDDIVEFIAKKHGEDSWVSLYKRLSEAGKSEDGSYYCVLAPAEKIPEAMKQASWDVMLGSGMPGFCTVYGGGKEVTTYHERSDDGFRNLVIYRDFHGRKEKYLEFSEEFRLFHNLYFESKTSTYLTFDDAGDEVAVITMTETEIKVRSSYLRSFMAATQMNLLLYFEITHHSTSRMSFAGSMPFTVELDGRRGKW